MDSAKSVMTLPLVATQLLGRTEYERMGSELPYTYGGSVAFTRLLAHPFGLDCYFTVL